MKELTLVISWIDVETQRVHITPINQGAQGDLVLAEGDRVVVGMKVEMFNDIVVRSEKAP